MEKAAEMGPLARLACFAVIRQGRSKRDPLIFDEIDMNFNPTIDEHIPIDYEHASESPTVDPDQSAPHMVEFLRCKTEVIVVGIDDAPPDAAQKYGKGNMFLASDSLQVTNRVTGQPIGARMTSGALTG